MRFAFFYHSLISDWNHGNAHFLRGVVSDLISRGHEVSVFEPETSWSMRNLVRWHGRSPIDGFHRAYPQLRSQRYRDLDLDQTLGGVDVALVHEWNDPELVARLGRHRARTPELTLLFHDTHHRAATAPEELEQYDLEHYDGVLAFGRVIRDAYVDRGWARQAWTWHEGADVRLFYPRPRERIDGDLVWIGNWGDDERGAELGEFLLDPIAALGLRATLHGVRYPAAARAELLRAGCAYAGWVANYDAPDVYARYRVTVHVPRRPYTAALPGIPTIRPFEAMACGIPLVSSPWEDTENLFTAGEDYLVARTGSEMREHLRAVLHDRELAPRLAARGRRTIMERHTCAHRVDELLEICSELRAEAAEHLTGSHS